MFSKKFKKSQKTWDHIKSVVTLKSKVKTSINSIFLDRNIIANRHFASKLASQIPRAKNSLGKYLKNRVLKYSFINSVKDTHEKLIKKLKTLRKS